MHREAFRRPALLSLAAILLAGCGEAPSEPPPPPPETTQQEAPPAMVSEPPVARQPDIPPPSAHIALNPGAYDAEGATLTLSALRFELEAPDRGVSASGSYEIINGVLTLNATSGETGEASFPLECRLSRSGPRILVGDVQEGSCGFLAGTGLQRDTSPSASQPE